MAYGGKVSLVCIVARLNKADDLAKLEAFDLQRKHLSQELLLKGAVRVTLWLLRIVKARVFR
jgi:hypothetical protein